MKRYFLLLGLFLLVLSVSPVHAAALAVPTGLSVSPDDRNAVLSWNGGENRPDQNDPAGVTGYKVTWTEPGGTVHTVITTDHLYQAQPLTNGLTYSASVQSVDSSGNLSDPTAMVTFTGTSSRVDGLRKSMTGFFDDFNLPAGAPDERKWNTAFSQCNGPQSGFFINAQFHVHTMVSTADGNCDRGQTVVRPRNTFDFTGRTGTISFDFDGEFRRDQWYLDLVPSAMDITGQTSIEGGGTNNPGSMLRFHQNGDIAEILVMDSSGLENSVAKTSWNPYPPLDWAGLGGVQNVRRHWQLKISQSHIDWFIDGTKVLSATVNLPFTKATVLWNEFSYNTPKANERYVTGHWDNFGFDGPASTVETHNYRATTYDTVARPSTPSYPITIPDSLTGATAQRFLYTLQMSPNTFYAYNSADHVTINGRAFPMPKPVLVAGDPAALISVISPYSQSIALASGVLHTGVNSVAFSCASCAVLNVHAEFDFPNGNAPSYTQPAMLMPDMAQPAPGAAFTAMDNGQQIDSAGIYCATCFVHNVSGKVTFTGEANDAVAVLATGKNIGLNTVEVLLDGAVVAHWDTHGTPRSIQSYALDTTTLSNGPHHLEIRATDTAGATSIPDYFDSDTQAGNYYPLNLNVQNATPPTPTATATATATAIPATATAQPTATSIATATAVPTATALPTETEPPTATATSPATATATALPTDTIAPTATAVATDTTVASTDTPFETQTPGVTPTSSPSASGMVVCIKDVCAYYPGLSPDDIAVKPY